MSEITKKTIGVNLDIKQIETDVEALVASMIKDRVKGIAQRAVADLFYDPANPYRTGHSSQLSAKESADLGYLRRMVDSTLTEVALDPKWDEVAKKVYDENIEKYVKEAAERKARHDANKLVFANRGERHKTEKAR